MTQVQPHKFRYFGQQTRSNPSEVSAGYIVSWLYWRNEKSDVEELSSIRKQMPHQRLYGLIEGHTLRPRGKLSQGSGDLWPEI